MAQSDAPAPTKHHQAPPSTTTRHHAPPRTHWLPRLPTHGSCGTHWRRTSRIVGSGPNRLLPPKDSERHSTVRCSCARCRLSVLVPALHHSGLARLPLVTHELLRRATSSSPCSHTCGVSERMATFFRPALNSPARQVPRATFTFASSPLLFVEIFFSRFAFLHRSTPTPTTPIPLRNRQSHGLRCLTTANLTAYDYRYRLRQSVSESRRRPESKHSTSPSLRPNRFIASSQ